jgi:hypothetical protein
LVLLSRSGSGSRPPGFETDDINALEILTLGRYLLGDEIERRQANERVRPDDRTGANKEQLKRFLTPP